MKKRNLDHLRTVLHRGIIACLAVALMFGVSIESLAAKEGKVTTEMANIRSSANAGAERVAQLPADSTFTVTEETTDGNGYVWYNIVFTLDGAQKSGWIRSDLAEITYDDTQTGTEGTEGTVEVSPVVDGITFLEPESQPEVTDDFTVSQVTVGETPFTAWAVNTELTAGAEFYLVYGMDAAGNSGWYYYDVQQGTLQRAAGQYTGGNSAESEGLIDALRQENEDLQKAQDKAVSMRNYIIIALGVFCVLLLVIVIVLAVKLNQIEYVDDEYDDDDYDDDEEEDDRKAGIPSWMELAKARKEEERRQKAKRDELEQELEEDEEDDFIEAYMDSKEDPEEAEEEEEELFIPKPVKKQAAQPLTQEPKKAAAKAVEAQERSVKPDKSGISEDDYDDSEDFDIEIVDLDDLDL